MIIKKTNLVNLSTKFNNHKINFNKSYNSFTSLKNSCNNQILNQLNAKINNYYSKISNDYAKISKYLDDFVKTAQGIENQICSKNVVIPDSQTASAVISYLKELKSCNKEVETKFQKAVKNFVFSSNNEFANFLSNVNDLDEVLTPEQLKNDETVKTLQSEITKLENEIDKLEKLQVKQEDDTKKLEQMKQQYQVINGFLELYKNKNLENYYNAVTLSGDFSEKTNALKFNSKEDIIAALKQYNAPQYVGNEDTMFTGCNTDYAAIAFQIFNNYNIDDIEFILNGQWKADENGTNKELLEILQGPAIVELDKTKGLYDYREKGITEEEYGKAGGWPVFQSGLKEQLNKMFYMTAEERKTYMYLYNTEGKESSENYYKYLEQQLLSREGEEKAKEFINSHKNLNTVQEYITYFGKGVADGEDSYSDNLAKALKKFLGQDDGKASFSANDYEVLYITQFLTQKYGDGYLSQEAFYEKVGINIGNMANSMVLSMIPIVGQAASSLSFGLSAYGGSYNQALKNGTNKWDAANYALTSAALEVGLERVIGAIPGLSNLSGNYIKDMFGEALEEGTQEVLDGLILSPIFLGEDAKLDWNAIKQSAFYGGLTSGILNIGSAPSTINDYINSAKNNGNINGMLNTFKNLFDAKNSDNVQGVKDSLKEIGFNDSEINTIINEKSTTTNTEINPKEEFNMFKDRTNETIEKLEIETESNTKNIELKNEYENLINKTKESWFKNAKEAKDNGYAGNLKDISEVDKITNRIKEIEQALNIKNSAVSEKTLNDNYYKNKDEADAFVNELKNKPIPGFKNNVSQENIETLYETPSPSGKQVLSQNLYSQMQNANLNTKEEFNMFKDRANETVENLGINFNNTNSPYNFSDVLENKPNIPNINNAETVSDVIDNTIEHIETNINDIINNMFSLKESVKGALASFVTSFTRMKTSKITENSEIYNKIKENGLYHVTSENAADQILESGYIKASGKLHSYGKNKSYFFPGLPAAQDVMVNLNGIAPKLVAVKFNASNDNITDFRYRAITDQAVSYEGNYQFNKNIAEKVYLGLTEENGKLTYKEISKEQYDSYTPNTSSSKLTEFKINMKNTMNAMAIEVDLFNNSINALKNSLENSFEKVKSSVESISNTIQNLFSNFTNYIQNLSVNTSKIKDILKNNKIKLFKNDTSMGIISPDSAFLLNQFKNNDNIELKNEYENLINKTKESWFKNAKEAKDNGYAGNLKDISEVDKITNRIKEIEQELNIKNSAVSEKSLNDNYYKNKEEADAFVNELKNKPIPGFKNNVSQENIETLYETPSPSGKQVLSHNNQSSISEYEYNALENFRKFFNRDLDVKKILYQNVPNELYKNDNVYVREYSDQLAKALNDMEYDITAIINDSDIDKSILTDIKSKFANYKEKLADCKYDYNKLASFYNNFLSNMSEEIVKETGTNLHGASISEKLQNDLKNLVVKSTTINELLHILHFYTINNDECFNNLPKIDEKEYYIDDYGTIENFSFYGQKTQLSQKLFDELPVNMGNGYMKLVSLNNKMILMVRDVGHATSFEIDVDGDILKINYYIPKMSKNVIDLINSLKGINKVNENSKYATGYFETTKENFVNEIQNLIKAIPTDNEYINGYVKEDTKEDIETLYETPSPSSKQVLSQNLYSQMHNYNSNINENSYLQEDISKIENAFDLNYNEEYDKGIIDGIRNVIEKNNFSDANVAKIVKNLDSILSFDEKFGFAVTPGTSNFWGPMHQLCLNTTLLKQSPGVISQTLFHEFGHAFLHLVKGNSHNLYNIELTAENKNIMEKTRDRLRSNPQSYIEFLKIANEIYNIANSETIQWYNKIRPAEEAKIDSLIEDLYNNDNKNILNLIVSESSKMTQVKEFLKESGVDISNIDEILNDKHLVKKIVTIQNNINKQQMHLNELMGSYEKYGDYRKLSAVINSATQQMNHFDSNTNQNVKCCFRHLDDYWTKVSEDDSFNRSFDELCADYFSLAAHGRNDVIAAMEKMFGTELMDTIKGTFKDIADVLETTKNKEE